LKINHTIIHKFTINNNDFKIFNYELDQTISSSDKVEFVFNNWTASKQIILPFVKINDRYCYIKTTATSDFGLITQYQSLGFLNNDCVNNILTYQCDPGATKSCVTDHLQGISTCSDSGLWSSCISTNQCETGYALSADSCLAQICTPNDTAACLSDNGSGTKKCNDTGLSYGTCQLSKCNAGFSLQNNTCVAQICSPNTITSCVINHKNGSKTCDSKGLLISDCIPTSPISCENNYYSLNNECLSQMCIPNATTTCQVSNGIGVKTCNNQGSAFGSCTATTCNSGYTLENGSCAIQVCTPNTSISCISNHLIGSQTCNASGTSYNSCTLSTNCESGFFYSNGTCTPQICEPGSSMGCVSNHLLGTKSCNQQGSSFSSCQLTTTCDSGYTFTNNTCQPMISSPSFFVLAGSSIKLSVEFTATGLVVSNSLSDNSLDLSSTVTNAKQQLSVDLKQLVYSPLLADHGKQTITLKAILDGGIVSIPVTINVMTPFTWTGSSSNVLDQNAKNNFCGSVTADNLACTGLPSLNYHTSENLLYTLKPGYNLAGNVSNDNAFYSFILDNTCSTNCNVNLQTHLYTKGLWLREYSFTQNQYNITYSGSGVILENQATFNGGSGSLSTPLNCDTESLGTNTSYYDFSCTNSIFNSPKTLRIGGNFTVNTTCTYNHFYTDDTLRFVSNVDSGSCNNWQKRSNISVPSSFTVNNLEFTGDNPTYDLLNSTITVAGNLLFEDKNLTASNRGSLLNGTIDTKGNVLLMDVRSVGNLLVKMTGSNNQTISCPIVNITHGFDTSSRAINDYYCMIPQLEINKTGGVLTGSDFLRFHNKFNYIAGSVDFSKAIGMFGDLVPSTSAYSITSSWNIPTTTTIVPTNVSVAPIITSEWYNGYNYQITITNNTGSQISDWKLCFDYNHKAPSSIWNAVYDSKTTSPNWVLNPQSYNHIIYPGSNVTLGWQGSYSISGDKISNLHLLINNDVSQDCSSQTSSFFKILYTTTNIPPNSICY